MIQNSLAFGQARPVRVVTLPGDNGPGLKIHVRCKMTPEMAQQMNVASALYVEDAKEGLGFQNVVPRVNVKAHKPGNEYENFVAKFAITDLPNGELNLLGDIAKGFDIKKTEGGGYEMDFSIFVKEAKNAVLDAANYMFHTNGAPGVLTLTPQAHQDHLQTRLASDDDEDEDVDELGDTDDPDEDDDDDGLPGDEEPEPEPEPQPEPVPAAKGRRGRKSVVK